MQKFHLPITQQKFDSNESFLVILIRDNGSLNYMFFQKIVKFSKKITQVDLFAAEILHYEHS